MPNMPKAKPLHLLSSVPNKVYELGCYIGAMDHLVQDGAWPHLMADIAA